MTAFTCFFTITAYFELFVSSYNSLFFILLSIELIKIGAYHIIFLRNNKLISHFFYFKYCIMDSYFMLFVYFVLYIKYINYRANLLLFGLIAHIFLILIILKKRKKQNKMIKTILLFKLSEIT